MRAIYKIVKESRNYPSDLYMNIFLKCEARRRLNSIKDRCIHPIIEQSRDFFRIAYYGNMEHIVTLKIEKQ